MASSIFFKLAWTILLIALIYIHIYLKEDTRDFCEPLKLAEGIQVRLKSAFIFTLHELLDFNLQIPKPHRTYAFAYSYSDKSPQCPLSLWPA